MGDPTSTPTMVLHAFEARYAAFRDELPPVEQALFDEAYQDLYRHVTALNRRPTVDAERPMFLAMLLAEKRRVREMDRRLRAVQAQADQLTAFIEDHHATRLSPQRGTRPVGTDLDRLGQARLPHYPQEVRLSAELPGGTPAETPA